VSGAGGRQAWAPAAPGMLRPPSGRLIRGQGLSRPLPPGPRAERVEVACLGGRGRTGTALACLAIIDGVPPREAVRYVRDRSHPRAVETFRQRRYVARFAAPGAGAPEVRDDRA